MTETWTPVAAETRITALITELTKAQNALAHARDVEVDTKHTAEQAGLRAWYSEQCPQPVRGGPTVADRDKYVELQTIDERFAHAQAVKDREIAVDYLRTLYTQASLAQTLTSSVGKAYDTAGYR